MHSLSDCKALVLATTQSPVVALMMVLMPKARPRWGRNGPWGRKIKTVEEKIMGRRAKESGE